MPADPFANARPYYDVTFPNSGDGFSIAGMKNALQGIGFLDMIPGQPRAHNPADMRVMVRGRDASSFYNPFYFGDADQRIPFGSGDSTTMSAPVSNPRYDIVYLTPSGDIRIVTGAEAASPTLPSLGPSGDTRLPICAIYHRTTETKIVNFEDKDSNTGDGYIYQDLRPWIRTKAIGTSISLTSVSPLSATGDNAVGSGTTAARSDHTHQGVHAIRVVGSGDMYGDVEFAGLGCRLNQQGGRITVETLEMVVGTYTGNGGDDRWIIIGFQDTQRAPKLVWIAPAVATNDQYVRLSTYVGDVARQFSINVAPADVIQNFDKNRFQVGAGDANTNAVSFHFGAWG